jgi:peptidoglycan/xylan/chitin deacetylase (PgdA/CDA1 family)
VWRLKRLIASAVGSIVDLDGWVARPGRRYVLAYHRVIPRSQAVADHAHDAMWVSPERLEGQIRWMQSVGEIVDYHRLLDFREPNDRPLFALTFDDGWRDTYEVAFPLLQRLNVPALVFLVSAAMDTGDLFWPEDVVTKTHRLGGSMGERELVIALRDTWPDPVPSQRVTRGSPAAVAEAWVEALKLVPFAERSQRIADYYQRIGVEQKPLQGYLMNWEHARIMQSRGIVFGSHTHTHRILKGLRDDDITYEVERSRRIISDQLRAPVDALCYPNARYNGREGGIIASCGYRYAFRIDSRAVTANDDRFYVPRFLISEQMAVSEDYFRLHLVEAPFFAGKPHDPDTKNEGSETE